MALLEVDYVDPVYGEHATNGKLNKSVKVGGTIFNKGISIKQVLGACRRAYESWRAPEDFQAQPEVLTFEQIKQLDKIHEGGGLSQAGRQFVPLSAYQNLQRELAALYQLQVDYPVPTFQQRLMSWAIACFGAPAARNKPERDYRFFEEATELIQARGNMTKEDAIRVIEYVFARPVGEVSQEIGGVMTCLAALCSTTQDVDGNEIDMMEAGENELTRIWGKMDVIREKQKQKVR